MKLRIENTEVTVYVTRKLIQELNQMTPCELGQIHKNEIIAKESILLFTSYLTKGFFRWISGESSRVALNGKILQRALGNRYKSIIILLEKKKVIGIHESYLAGGFSKKYWIEEDYLKSNITGVKLTNPRVLKRHKKNEQMMLDTAKNNVIANFLMEITYPFVKMPMIDEILEKGKELAKSIALTNKGKIITYRGKKAKKSWASIRKRSFVEDAIKQYQSFTDGGLKIPTVGRHNSGGRVYDSFSLLTSWIRSMATINGNKLVELDFSCLHPNIANYLYGEPFEHISHQMVADYFEVTKNEIKHQHLAFFNLKNEQFVSSKIYKYYENYNPLLLGAIKQKKQCDGYKSICHESFRVEVELMTKVIEELHQLRIPALYVFDALMVEPVHVDTVRDIMSKVVENMGVFSVVK